MNFLLHHHLALRDLGSRAAAAGAMLPDLWRIADRRVRATDLGRAPHDAQSDRSDALADVLNGIAHHLVADHWFHADPVFLDGERATAAAFRDAALGVPRLGLFAHITWELCLDGALVRAEGAALADSVQRSLEDASREGAADRAAAIHHFDRVARTSEETRAFAERMTRIATELGRGAWIDGYAHGAGIADRIDGVRRRVGFAAMSPEECARLAAVADRLLDRAAAALPDLVSRGAR
jgi:hypothetical protein